MASFGELIIHMVLTIIHSAIDLTLVLMTDLFQLFHIVSSNAGTASPVVIALAVVIIAVIVYFLFKVFKGNLKHFVIAFIILIIILFFVVTVL